MLNQQIKVIFIDIFEKIIKTNCTAFKRNHQTDGF